MDALKICVTDESIQASFSRDYRNSSIFRGILEDLNGGCSLVYISETILKHLNRMQNIAIHMDDTFRAAPKHLEFTWLYIVTGGAKVMGLFFKLS